ncbi:MAG: hypothetical protein H7Y37_03110 [Anaerolineae bacterium]|nr:hypothetical protein [Gloeobacterales cyanobacterium ES-bin-313]
MSTTPLILEQALELLGELLEEYKAGHEIVVIGGGGLVLLHLIDRATRDIDVVALFERGTYQTSEPLPPVLKQAIKEVALVLNLDEDWLNAAPTDLLRRGLPEGFQVRAIVRQYKALTVQLASRYDQIHFKLYAAVDQGPKSKHFADLKRLLPNTEELIAAARWCLTQADGIEEDLRGAMHDLGVQGNVEL